MWLDDPLDHLSERSYPKHIARTQATALHRAIQKTRVLAPRTDCIVPIGEPNLLKGLRKELEADFITVTTRPAAAYRGNPFQMEVGIAHGLKADAAIEVDSSGHMRKKASEHLEKLIGAPHGGRDAWVDSSASWPSQKPTMPYYAKFLRATLSIAHAVG